MEWSNIPACPSLICFFDKGIGTNSLRLALDICGFVFCNICALTVCCCCLFFFFFFFFLGGGGGGASGGSIWTEKRFTYFDFFFKCVFVNNGV